jgi:predicted AlkP superfamily phosphohydrolase/phosphomutase
VVIIGLDAFDVGIALDLVVAGRLPTIAGMLDEWWHVPTVLPPGLEVGGIWPSITTGAWPSPHGFYCDRQIVPGTYEAQRRGPQDIDVPRLWNQLSSNGCRCVVLDVPLTMNSRPLKGLQLVEWGAHDHFRATEATPPQLLDDVFERFGDYPLREKCDDYAADGALGELRDDLLRGIERKRALAAHYLTNEDWQFFMTVFAESHCAGHQFWSVHDTAHPAHEPARRAELGDPLLSVYERVDRALGELLADVPDDAHVLVVLSHGIGPHYDGGHLLSAILRAFQGGDPAHRLANLREGAIRRITRRGRVKRDAKPLEGGYQFFKVPNNELYGGIRINLRGREPRGRVRPGDEFDTVAAELTAGLLMLENPDTGDVLVRAVMRTSDLYQGPRLDALPDLLVDWNRDAPIFGARSPKIGVIRGEPMARRSGDHRAHGHLFVKSANIRTQACNSIPRKSVPVVDIAPTVAAVLGVELRDVDGEPVRQLVDALC